MTSGHPPRQQSSASARAPLHSTWHGVNLPRNSPASDTSAVESSDSESVMGAMWMRPILPAPLWRASASHCFSPSASGVDEPVRMNTPRMPRFASTAWRTAFHMPGALCHSSITCGRFPSSMRVGSARANEVLLPSSTYVTLEAWASELHVLPHHLGPATSTAPKTLRYLSIWASAMRGR